MAKPSHTAARLRFIENADGQYKEMRELSQPDAGRGDLLRQAITRPGLPASAYDSPAKSDRGSGA